MRLALVVVRWPVRLALLVRLVFIVPVRKHPHVAKRGGQNIRALPIHFHLANAVPFTPPTAMRRERAFLCGSDSAKRRHCFSLSALRSRRSNDARPRFGKRAGVRCIHIHFRSQVSAFQLLPN